MSKEIIFKQLILFLIIFSNISYTSSQPVNYYPVYNQYFPSYDMFSKTAFQFNVKIFF